MNTITNFLSTLYDVYYSGFVIGGKTVAPAHIAVLLTLAVAAGLWYGLVLEPRFVQRYMAEHGSLEGIDARGRWFRLGHFSILLLLAASYLLACFWP